MILAYKNRIPEKTDIQEEDLMIINEPEVGLPLLSLG